MQYVFVHYKHAWTLSYGFQKDVLNLFKWV